MLKASAIIAVPGVLGGIGMLYDHDGTRDVPLPNRGAYVVEMGVAFDPDAARAALPEGLELAPGGTGGIVIYGGDEGWALSPLSTGYVWIDIARTGQEGAPARYMLMGFATEEQVFPEAGSNVPRAAVHPDEASVLALQVRVAAEGCADGLSDSRGQLLAAGPGENLGTINMPVVMDLCPAEAVSAQVSAPAGHVLGGLAPERVLWASVGTPLRWAMPELAVK